MIGLGEWMMILELHREGLSVSAIAQRSGLDRKTVRKYIRAGVHVPKYKARALKPRLLDAYVGYLTQRIQSYPGLSVQRLLREIREMGYAGSRTILGDFLREIRPTRAPHFERRFETAAGEQAQVDFAHFNVEFEDVPGQRRSIWLFSLVLGHSRYLWARFVEHQDLQTLLRCHIEAFTHLGGVPRQLLYDRMKSAVLGETGERHIVYNTKLIALAQHYGFAPRACKPYRAKTKGKVERPFRYIRQDFFLARRFRNLGELNAQLRHWLDTVANLRVHGTTQRIVAEHYAQEQPSLQALPASPFNGLIRLERRVSHDGLVSVGGNYYSVPEATRRRVLEVHSLAHEVRIFEENQLLAIHPVLEGRRQVSMLPGHRQARRSPDSLPASPSVAPVLMQRSLAFYAAVGQRLAAGQGQ